MPVSATLTNALIRRVRNLEKTSLDAVITICNDNSDLEFLDDLNSILEQEYREEIKDEVQKRALTCGIENPSLALRGVMAIWRSRISYSDILTQILGDEKVEFVKVADLVVNLSAQMTLSESDLTWILGKIKYQIILVFTESGPTLVCDMNHEIHGNNISNIHTSLIRVLLITYEKLKIEIETETIAVNGWISKS